MKAAAWALFAIVLVALSSMAPALAQDAEPAPHSDEDLAKKLTNPVADLASIPFQFNWQNGVGEDDALRFILEGR